MPFLLTLIIGAAAGFLATKMMKLDVAPAVAVAIGVVGAAVGLVIVRLVIGMIGMASQLLLSFAGAIAGAVLVIWVYQTYIAKK